MKEKQIFGESKQGVDDSEGKQDVGQPESLRNSAKKVNFLQTLALRHAQGVNSFFAISTSDAAALAYLEKLQWHSWSERISKYFEENANIHEKDNPDANTKRNSLHRGTQRETSTKFG